MTSPIRRAFAFAAAFSIIACGSDSTGTDGGGGGGASMKATVGGAAFNPPSVTVDASFTGSVLTLQGSSSSMPVTAISIHVLDVTGPGTYQLNPNFIGTFGQVAITSGTTVQLWTTALSPGNGSITVTTLSDTRVAGTFRFTAQAASEGATGQQSVTSGTFDISL